MCQWNFTYENTNNVQDTIRQLRARRALLTYTLYSDSALLALKRTSALTAPPPPFHTALVMVYSQLVELNHSPFRLPFSSSLCLLYGSLLRSNTYPKWTVHSLMPIFMFAINTLYHFLLFTLSCILCIPYIFCFNRNFAERRKQIKFNSIQSSHCNNALLALNWQIGYVYSIENIETVSSQSVDDRSSMPACRMFTTFTEWVGQT